MSGSRSGNSLAAIIAKREQIEEEVKQVEKQVYDLETTYLNEQSQVGNVLKGFEGFLSSSKNNSSAKGTTQKRGRTGPREGKRMRQAAEQEEDEDEVENLR